MQSTFTGPKFATLDKKTETGHQTRAFKPQTKDYTGLLNISTKFNGIGGSKPYFPNFPFKNFQIPPLLLSRSKRKSLSQTRLAFTGPLSKEVYEKTS